MIMLLKFLILAVAAVAAKAFQAEDAFARKATAKDVFLCPGPQHLADWAQAERQRAIARARP